MVDVKENEFENKQHSLIGVRDGADRRRGAFGGRLRVVALLAAFALLLLSCALAGCENQGASAGSASSVQSSDSAGDAAMGARQGDSLDERVRRIVDGMTLEEKVAQMFLIQPEVLTGVEAVIQAGDTSKECFGRYPVGGLLFSYPNLESPDQVREMLAGFQDISKDRIDLPLFACVDEEGGTVTRVASSEGFGVSDVGNMSDLGASGDPAKAREAADYLSSYLKSLGFTVDFAPVADIANIEGSEMRYRSFGSTSDAVAPMVQAEVEGFLSNGMMCSAKHFPGIGGASGDSHEVNIYSDKTVDQMKEEELIPFVAAIQADVPFVMVGHLSVPSVTGDDTPASLSEEMVTDLLRNDLGYRNIIITDSLGMGAVVNLCEPAEVGVAAIEAGNDMILSPADFPSAYQGVLDAVASGRIGEDRIDESLERIVRIKLQYMGDL